MYLGERARGARGRRGGPRTWGGSGGVGPAARRDRRPTPGTRRRGPSGGRLARPAADSRCDQEAHAEQVTLRFEGRRCVHARHCVLSAPEVFLANVQGPWLHPEATTVEALARVAHSFPSGAITYVRRDGGPDEETPRSTSCGCGRTAARVPRRPPESTASPRGPGPPSCRCGRSQSKPFCDGSQRRGSRPAASRHRRIRRAGGAGRRAHGPAAGQRPLDVRGNLEVCSGTGRSVRRTTGVRLCRCGGSANKPFCDGTHTRNRVPLDLTAPGVRWRHRASPAPAPPTTGERSRSPASQ